LCVVSSADGGYAAVARLSSGIVGSPDDPRAGDDGTFDVVFVCTGNRARSPFAAEVLRDLTDYLPVSVASRGTVDVGGAPGLPEAVWAAGQLAVDLRSHRARSLARDELVDSDLVVGFEPLHVAEAVVRGGSAREKSFLITELAGLLESGRVHTGHDASFAWLAVEQAADARRAEHFVQAEPVADPLGRSRHDVLATFEQVRDLVEVIAAGLFGVRARRVVN